MTITSYRERYHSALRRMQSGVAAFMNLNSKETEPKHLRVGVNSAHVSIAALVRLLTERGLVTELDYFRFVAEEMEREVKGYEEQLSVRTGAEVTLVECGLDSEPTDG